MWYNFNYHLRYFCFLSLVKPNLNLFLRNAILIIKPFSQRFSPLLLPFHETTERRVKVKIVLDLEQRSAVSAYLERNLDCNITGIEYDVFHSHMESDDRIVAERTKFVGSKFVSRRRYIKHWLSKSLVHRLVIRPVKAEIFCFV